VSDACDVNLTQSAATSFIYAFSTTPSLVYHGTNRGAGVLNFTQNSHPIPPAVQNGTVYQLPSSSAVFTGSPITLYWDFYDGSTVIDAAMGTANNTDNNTIIFTIAINNLPEGYVGIGYDATLMTPTSGPYVDMTVAIIYNGTVTIADYTSTKEGAPTPDSTQGCASNIILLGYNITNEVTYIKFMRPLIVNDTCDVSLAQSSSANFIYAFSTTSSLVYHGTSNRAAVNFDFTEGSNGAATLVNSRSFITKVHAWFLLIAWGIMIDVSFFFSRYLKTWSKYALVHGLLSGVIVIGTLFLGIWKVVELWGQERTTSLTYHFYIGLVIMGLLVLQSPGGIFIFTKMQSFKAFSKLEVAKLGHMITGGLIYVLAKANLFFGIYTYNSIPGFTQNIDPLLYYALPMSLGAIFLMKMVTELQHRAKYNKPYIFKTADQIKSSNPEHQKLLKLLSQDVPLSRINVEIDPNVKWVTLDDTLYVLDDFLHPGGNFIVEAVKGREIGRFIYGAYGLEIIGDETKHLHSFLAKKALDEFAVGVIPQNLALFSGVQGGRVAKDDSLNSIKSSLLTSMSANKWRLAAKTELSSTTVRYEFECSGTKVNSRINNLAHFGKHFKINHPNHPTTRLYTVIISQDERNCKFRESLYETFESLLNTPLEAAVLESEFKHQTHTLPLVIKNYRTNSAFSSYIYNAEVGKDEFNISGPHGLGLGLSHDSEGEHYIFAAGTGILPFLDLFDCLLRKVIHEALSARIPKPQLQKLNIIDEELADSFNKNIRFTLFASFREPDDFVGKMIIEKLCDYCNRFNSKMFRATIRIARDDAPLTHAHMTRERFDATFIRKQIGALNEHAPKVFICGPPIFNKEIYQAVTTHGISKERITLV
jgi:NAD(P)H-flavin reductase